MSGEQGAKRLLCFQHCDRHTNIVCFTVPPTCPLCRQSTTLTESRVPPFLLPSPFASSRQSPCSIAVKPTHGTFTRNYSNSVNLHVGITDSSGTILDFDEEGLHGDSVWLESLTIPMLANSGLKPDQWDKKLYEYANPHMWSSHRYDEFHRNCFDFVLGFLQWLNLHHTVLELCDKQSFIKHFLLNKTTKVGQFISLYGQVEQSGVVCQEAGSS